MDSPGFSTLLDTPSPVPTEDGPARSVHPIAKLGKFSDRRYGEFAITSEMVDSWKRNMATLQNGRIPIDYDHAADTGGSTKAAGWITDLELNGDKVDASIEWTPEGAQAIRDRYWQYVSPSFTKHMRGEAGEDMGEGLAGVAVTNRPFLRRGMPAINLTADAEPEFAEQVAETDYSLRDFTADERKSAAKKGNALPDGSYPINSTSDLKNAVQAFGRAKNKAAVKAHIVKRAKALGATGLLPTDWEPSGAPAQLRGGVGDTRSEMPDLTKFAEVLKLDEDSDEDTILAKVTELVETPEDTKTLEEQAKDEGKALVSADELSQLRQDASEGKAANAQLKEQAFTLAFDKALSEGRMDAQDETRETYRDLYDTAPEQTLKLLAAAPKIVSTEAKGKGSTADTDLGPVVDESGEVNHEALDRKVQLRMSEKDEPYDKALTAVMAEVKA